MGILGIFQSRRFVLIYAVLGSSHVTMCPSPLPPTRSLIQSPLPTHWFLDPSVFFFNFICIVTEYHFVILEYFPDNRLVKKAMG